MKLTVKEIVDMAGVSVTIILQTLNNKGSRFNGKTRSKVSTVVAEDHYKPDYSASNVINRRFKTIDIAVLDVTGSSFSKVTEDVETHLNSPGYTILLCNSRHDSEQAIQYVSELIHRSVDGIILTTPNVLLEDHTLKDRREHPIPVVLVDCGTNPRDSGRPTVEEYEGVYQVVHHLVQQGHRHIGMLRESADYYRLAERVTTYRHALQNNNLPLRPHYVYAGELNLHGDCTAAKGVLKNEETIAIFCGNDRMAMGAYQAIEEADKRIPDDISAVSLGNLEISEYLVPGLTTVYQPSFDIGYYAAEFLVETIVNPTGKVPNKIFDATFIARKGTRPIQRAAQRQNVHVVFVFTRKKQQ